MSIAEKLSTIANNVSKVYDAGYEQGKSEGVVAKEEQEKTIDIIKNGTTEVIPDDGKTLSKVTVNVDVASDNSLFISTIDGSVTDLVIPRGVVNIRPQSFRGCDNLQSVYINNEVKNVGQNAFYANKKLETITWEEPTHDFHRLGPYAFQNCTSLKEITFPLNLYGIDGYCFDGCTGLTSITFKYKPENGIAATVFRNCTNLLDIYVPWAEGEAPNSPWGATNATIHYNSEV